MKIQCHTVPLLTNGNPVQGTTAGTQYECYPCNDLGTYFYYVDDAGTKCYSGEQYLLKYFDGVEAVIHECKVIFEDAVLIREEDAQCEAFDQYLSNSADFRQHKVTTTSGGIVYGYDELEWSAFCKGWQAGREFDKKQVD